MINMTIVTGFGGDVCLDAPSARLRPRGDLAPGATPGIAYTGIHPLGLAALR